MSNQRPTDATRRAFNVMDSLVIAGLIGLAGMIFTMRDTLTRLQVTAENTNRQLAELQAQLSDVPALSREVAELKVRVSGHDEAIKDLRHEN